MKKIIVTGNVGKNPEMRKSQNEEVFVTFSLGISVGTKEKPKTDWVDINCNGKLAEVAAKHVTQGSKLLIEGFPVVHAYINKDGHAVGVLRIHANNFEFCSKKEGDNDNEYNSNN